MIEGIPILTFLKYSLAIIFCLIFIATFVLLYLNRSSDKILLTVLPALVLGATAALITMIFTLQEDTQKIEFSAFFTYDKTSHLSLWSTNSSVPMSEQDWATAYLIQEMMKKNPSLVKGTDPNDLGMALYKDVALRIIVETLFQYFGLHWDINLKKLSMPFQNTARYGSFPDSPQPEFLSWGDAKKLFDGHTTFDIEITTTGKLALPQGTRLVVSEDTPSHDLPCTTISLTNRFVTVKISVATSGGSQGVGYLAPLLPYTDEQKSSYWTSQYLINLSAEFNPLRSGNPDMPRYKRWVSNMFEEIENRLDVRRHWERAREAALLKQFHVSPNISGERAKQ